MKMETNFQDEKKRLSERLKQYHDWNFTPGKYEHSIFGLAALLLDVDSAPVVRCKDCDNYHEFISGFRCVHFNGGDGRAYQTGPNDFCSYGKRRCEDG